MIIGLSGKIATGKTTAANYLHDSRGFTILSTRDLLSGILEAKKVKVTRKSLQQMGNDLISLVGAGGFVAIMLEYLPQGDYVVDAIRYVGAIDFLRSKYGKQYRQIHIIAKDDLRYARMKQKGDLGSGITDYKKFEEAPTELDPHLERKADFRVVNEKSLNAFYSKLEKVHSTINR